MGPANSRRALMRLCATVFLVAGSACAGATQGMAADSVAADQYFGGTFYLASNEDGSDYAAGAALGWNDWVIALAAPGDLESRLLAPGGTDSVVTFIAPQGHESDPTSWNATAAWDFLAPGQLLPDVTPYHQIDPGSGTPSGTNATSAATGDYSIGVAYMKDGGQHLVAGGLYFIHIHLTGNSDPEKATYTWQPVQATGAPSASGSSGEGPTATQSVDGILALSALSASGATTPLTIHDGQGKAGWSVTVATGADVRTLATGTVGDTQVDIPATDLLTVTITLVSG